MKKYFVQYDDKDEAAAEQMRVHLHSLRRNRQWVEVAAKEADVILLLLSPDLLENRRKLSFIEKKLDEGARIIPIRWKKCRLTGPLSALAQTPHDEWVGRVENNVAWSDIMRALLKL